MSRLLVTLAVVVGACLRFYALGTPSMWWDEVLVPLTSRHSLEYILDFCRYCEIHPPLFYIITKGVLIFGESEFALRFLPALFGVASIYLAYIVVTKYAGQVAGSLASVMLAVDPFAVSVSRQVRPYTLVICLCFVSLYYLKNYLDDRRLRSAVQLALANCALIFLHYTSVLFVAAECAVVVVVSLAFRRPVMSKQNAVLALMTLVAVVGMSYFAVPYFQSHRGIVNSATHWDIVVSFSRNSVAALLGGFYFSPVPLVVAYSLGLFALLKRDVASFVVGLSVPLFTLVALLTMKYGSFFNPWHLSFLLPTYLVVLTSAFCWKVVSRKYQYVLGLLFLVFLYSGVSSLLVGKYDLRGTGGIVKEEVAVLRDPSFYGQVVYAEPSQLNVLSWHLSREKVYNAFSAPRVEPLKLFNIYFAADEKRFQEATVKDEDLHAVAGEVRRVHVVENTNLYSWNNLRPHGVAFTHLPFEDHVPMTISGFTRSVYSSTDLALMSNSLVPVFHGLPGSFESLILNDSGVVSPQVVTLIFQYSNRSRNSQITFEVWFDDEVEHHYKTSIGPDVQEDIAFVIDRNKYYSKIHVRVALSLNDISPAYAGGNQETLQFKSFDVYVREK
ncbi:glycosyltransferase family 39 protein [Fundidesulfovibrio putealis]|uniref:glycosyltransferase family 39 protein n=1 Tax=Fundidesulfovibrio putealis TaxID=270496 RepID=UPI0003FED8AE|nr:glycosyltransferase family 39 protein [Fundidesulfovibrio putealis]